MDEFSCLYLFIRNHMRQSNIRRDWKLRKQYWKNFLSMEVLFNHHLNVFIFPKCSNYSMDMPLVAIPIPCIPFQCNQRSKFCILSAVEIIKIGIRWSSFWYVLLYRDPTLTFLSSRSISIQGFTFLKFERHLNYVASVFSVKSCEGVILEEEELLRLN